MANKGPFHGKNHPFNNKNSYHKDNTAMRPPYLYYGNLFTSRMSSHYWDSHYLGKTVSRPTDLYHGVPYTDQMASLCWNDPQAAEILTIVK